MSPVLCAQSTYSRTDRSEYDDHNVDSYLEWLVGYQFPALTQFFARVEDLVVTVGAADVTYHEPRRNLESTLKKQGDMKVGSLDSAAKRERLRFQAVVVSVSCIYPRNTSVCV